MVWQIPVLGNRAFDGASMFLCLLAYPADQKKCATAFWAMVAYRIRLHRKRNKLSGVVVRGDVSDLRARILLKRYPEARMWGVLNLLNKQLGNRICYAELLAYIGRVTYDKPLRPQRITLKASAVRLEHDPALRHRLTFTSDTARIEVEPALPAFPTSQSDLVKIGAQRWNMEPGNVRKNIIIPGKPVAHLAISLRDLLLDRSALLAGATLTRDTACQADALQWLLRCPQWVLRAVEDAQIVAQTWSVNAAQAPSWRSVDPSTFLDLRVSTEPETV